MPLWQCFLSITAHKHTMINFFTAFQAARVVQVWGPPICSQGSSYCCQEVLAYMLASLPLLTPQVLCLRAAARKAGSARHLVCLCWSRRAQNQHQRAQLLPTWPAPGSTALCYPCLINLCKKFLLRKALKNKRAMQTLEISCASEVTRSGTGGSNTFVATLHVGFA
jgi:hypothetical protein